MKKPPDPLLNPSPQPPQFTSQRQFSDFFVVSGFQINPITSLSGGSLIVDYYRNQGQYPWFDSAKRHLGTRLASWVFGTAYLQGDLGMAISDPSLSKASMSTVFVRVLGAGEDQKRRLVAIIGVVRKLEAQISLRFSSHCFFLFVDVNLVNSIRSLMCDDECSVLCLSRSRNSDYAQCVEAYDSGWVINVSKYDLFVSETRFKKWLRSSLNCVDSVLEWPWFSPSTFWWLVLDSYLMLLLIGWVEAYNWMWIVANSCFPLVELELMFLLDRLVEYMFALSIRYPLSAIIGTVGSRIDANISVFPNTSTPQLSSPCLLERTRLAIILSWLSCRFVSCCYQLVLGITLVSSFDCCFSWTLWNLVCWWVYGLCIWIVNLSAPFNLLNDNMWRSWSESHRWIAQCDYVRSALPVSARIQSVLPSVKDEDI